MLVLKLLLLILHLHCILGRHAAWEKWPNECALPGQIDEGDVLVDVDTPKTGSKRRRTALIESCSLQQGKLPIRVVSNAGNRIECKFAGTYIIPAKAWHTGVGIYEKVALEAANKRVDARIFAFTTLRSPPERVVSEWAELAIGRDMWLSVRYQNKTLMSILRGDLKAFVEYAECPAHNRQTWMLAQTQEVIEVAKTNYVNATGQLGNTFRPDLFYEMWKWYYNGAENYIDLLNRDGHILKIAKQTLEHLTVFGITEKSVESWKLFDDVFRNTTIYSPSIPTNTFMSSIEAHSNKKSSETFHRLTKDPTLRWLHKRILHKNKLDLALYKFATELFQKRVAYCLRFHSKQRI